MATAVQPEVPISKAIPTKKVVLNDPNQIPADYSTTPGGTWFSTTPGGTRIVYDRRFMLNLRNSPLSHTPPKNLPNIPGVVKGTETVEAKPDQTKVVHGKSLGKVEEAQNETDDQFQMDM